VFPPHFPPISYAAHRGSLCFSAQPPTSPLWVLEGRSSVPWKCLSFGLVQGTFMGEPALVPCWTNAEQNQIGPGHGPGGLATLEDRPLVASVAGATGDPADHYQRGTAFLRPSEQTAARSSLGHHLYSGARLAFSVGGPCPTRTVGEHAEVRQTADSAVSGVKGASPEAELQRRRRGDPEPPGTALDAVLTAHGLNRTFVGPFPCPEGVLVTLDPPPPAVIPEPVALHDIYKLPSLWRRQTAPTAVPFPALLGCLCDRQAVTAKRAPTLDHRHTPCPDGGVWIHGCRGHNRHRVQPLGLPFDPTATANTAPYACPCPFCPWPAGPCP
jgi:hypothetical protein